MTNKFKYGVIKRIKIYDEIVFLSEISVFLQYA